MLKKSWPRFLFMGAFSYCFPNETEKPVDKNILDKSLIKSFFARPDKSSNVFYTDEKILRNKYLQYSKKTQDKLIEIDRSIERASQLSVMQEELGAVDYKKLFTFYEYARKCEIEADPDRKKIEAAGARLTDVKSLLEESKYIPSSPTLKIPDKRFEDWIVTVLTFAGFMLLIIGLNKLDAYLRGRKKINDERRKLALHIRNQKRVSRGILYDWYQKLRSNFFGNSLKSSQI